MTISVPGEPLLEYMQVGRLIRECRKRTSASSKLFTIIVNNCTREREQRDNHNEHCELQWQIESSPQLSNQCHSNVMQLKNGGGVGLIWVIPPDRHGMAKNLTHRYSDIHIAGYFARTLPPLLSLPSVNATAIQRESSTATEGTDALTSRGAMVFSLSKPAPDGDIDTGSQTLDSNKNWHLHEEADRLLCDNSFYERRYGLCYAS